jgi:radical SAM-linked protein
VRGAKGVDLRMHDSRTSWLEGVFARGDRKLGRVLLRAYRDGARFDSWDDQLKIEVWVKAFAEEGIDPKSYLGTIPVSARLPWSHIDVGLEEGFLVREYRKALKSRLSPPCGKAAGAFVHHTNLEDAHADERKLVCYDCGVACDLSAMRTERVDFLGKLGAEKPRVTLPIVKAPPPEPKPVADMALTDGERMPKKKGPKPPPRIIQGDARRVRFLYAKVGPMAFLSHLDVVRAIPRSFRRLDVPLYYTSGFHPKPDMTFSPALSLGVASLAEILDVKVTVDVNPEELAKELTRVSPEGLVFRNAVAFEKADRPLSQTISGARYAVGIPRKALASGQLEAEVDRVLSATDVRVIRRFERGLAKSIDVKKFLRTITVGDDRATKFLADARVAGDLVPILVDVDMTDAGGVKIAEVMEALFGKNEDGDVAMPYHAVRAELGLWQGEGAEATLLSPLALDTLRSLVAA